MEGLLQENGVSHRWHQDIMCWIQFIGHLVTAVQLVVRAGKTDSERVQLDQFV